MSVATRAEPGSRSAYDVTVVGTGAGGGTLAQHLAPSIVDTSVLPRIGAVKPALTAMANALRVGDHLLERVG